MKFTVKKASNGWIVNIHNYGLSVLKEPYGESLYVFNDLQLLFKFIEELNGK